MTTTFRAEFADLSVMPGDPAERVKAVRAFVSAKRGDDVASFAVAWWVLCAVCGADSGHEEISLCCGSAVRVVGWAPPPEVQQ